MKILILTYYWPPGSGPGVQRWLKMSHELCEPGHEVTVVTVADGAYPSMDESLVSEVDSRVRVIRTATREPFRLFNRLRGKKGKEIPVGLTGIKESSSPIQRFAIWLRANYFIPDARKGWRPYAIRAIEDILKENELDVIITSGPPHSLHKVGQHFQMNHGMKWVADFRDPWVNIHYHELMPMSPKAKAKHQHMEDEVLQKADLVTVVSPGMEREFRDRANDIRIIYNGYDQEDFDAVSTEVDEGVFSISYVGNLKPNQNVEAFWTALVDCCAVSEAFRTKMRLRLIGRKDPGLVQRLEQMLPPGALEDIPYLEHQEAVHAMCRSSVLLFIIPKAKDNQAILTGKLFEYLASGRPMLSIGPVDGDAAHILEHTGAGKMLDYANGRGMRERLLELFQHPQEAKPSTAVDGYSRKEQTAQLMDALRRFTS